MKIIIAGAGEVGAALTQNLVGSGYEITLIDGDKEALEAACEHYDILGVQGNCASVETLEAAGVKSADLIVAVTNADEVNLLCCVTARHLNGRVHAIARVRNPEYVNQTFSMQEVFGLAMTINPEQATAHEIGQLLRYPGFLGRDAFAKGRVEIVELQVSADSPMNGLMLKDLSSSLDCRLLVCSVIREGKAIMPGGSFTIREGDRVFVTAPSKILNKLLRKLGIITHRVKRVILCGGGRISFYLARALEQVGIETQIIEQNKERCEWLARELPDSAVICGDASNRWLLQSEGLMGCDALVSLTDRDELNVLISMYAKTKGVPLVITRQSERKRLPMLDELALGTIISPKDVCSDAIVQYVRSMRDSGGDTAVTVQSIADGFAQASEFIIRPGTPNQNVPLKDLALKDGVLVAAISRGKNIEIAGGLSTFTEGDSVIIISQQEEIVHFGDIFA